MNSYVWAFLQLDGASQQNFKNTALRTIYVAMATQWMISKSAVLAILIKWEISVKALKNKCRNKDQ